MFLARHGETEWNRAGRRQGQFDAPLTPSGIDEVRRAAKGLRGLPIDAVFSSPLGRAFSSARLYADALGLTVVTVDELGEIHHGAMAGLSGEEIDAAFPGEMSRRAADKYVGGSPTARATPRATSGRPRRYGSSARPEQPGRYSSRTR